MAQIYTKKGIKPDVTVSFSDDDIKAKRDVQLIKANELLVRMINYQPKQVN